MCECRSRHLLQQVLLHIPLEPRLVALQKIHDNLADSASFVIEDYLLKTPNGREDLTDEEKHLLEDVIGAVCAPTVGDYRQHLESVGFVDVEFEDLSAVWTKWTVSRRDRFLSKRARQVELHGEAHVEKMETFYKAPPVLFESGKLGGYRITGRKKENRIFGIFTVVVYDLSTCIGVVLILR